MAFVVSAIGAAWAAGAAIVAGGAITAGAVATIAAGVAAAGTVLTVVGTVTKSKELLKIGKVMSIAGGITAIGAGLISSMGSAAASSAASSGATNVVPGIGGGAADAATGVATDAMTNQAVDSAAGSFAQTFPVGPSSLSGLGETTSVGMSQAQDLALNNVPNVSVAPASRLGGMSGISATGPGQSSAATQPTGASAPMGSSVDAAIKKPGMLESIGDFWKTLPPTDKAKYASQLLQVGGSAVGGLFQGWSEQQKMDLQREINNEHQKRYDTGQKNGNFVPVIGFQPRLSGGGLINSGGGRG